MTTTDVRRIVALAVLVCAGPALAGTGAKKAPSRAAQAEIRRALSAAPAAVGARAAVVRMGDDGRMTELRPGTNGWTCLPRDPGTPTGAPLCVDANGLAWLEAAMAGKEPDPAKVGYSYMLRGGSAWSILDPAATKLPDGETEPVTIPPHVMILNARLAEESGFPSGVAHPDTTQPFVAYGGTPYAILIIPVR